MFDLRIQLTPFEQATLEQLVSFKAKEECEIEHLLKDERLQQEAIKKVAQWDKERISKGLEPWNEV